MDEELAELIAEYRRLFPPAEWNGVGIHHSICSGAPCVMPRRIPTWALAGRFEAGESIASIAEDYDLTGEQVEAALRFELMRRRVKKWWEKFGYSSDPTKFWNRNGIK